MILNNMILGRVILMTVFIYIYGLVRLSLCHIKDLTLFCVITAAWIEGVKLEVCWAAVRRTAVD